MTLPEYQAVLDIITARGLSDKALTVYTVGHEFEGYPVAGPNAGVVYFCSVPYTHLDQPPGVGGGPPGTVYTCLALEAITAIELTA